MAARHEPAAHVRWDHNPEHRAALLELLGKPIEECSALVISTASYPLRGGPKLARDFIAGEEPQTPMAELGWASVGVLELEMHPLLDDMEPRLRPLSEQDFDVAAIDMVVNTHLRPPAA